MDSDDRRKGYHSWSLSSIVPGEFGRVRVYCQYILSFRWTNCYIHGSRRLEHWETHAVLVIFAFARGMNIRHDNTVSIHVEFSKFRHTAQLYELIYPRHLAMGFSGAGSKPFVYVRPGFDDLLPEIQGFEPEQPMNAFPLSLTSRFRRPSAGICERSYMQLDYKSTTAAPPLRSAIWSRDNRRRKAKARDINCGAWARRSRLAEYICGRYTWLIWILNVWIRGCVGMKDSLLQAWGGYWLTFTNTHHGNCNKAFRRLLGLTKEIRELSRILSPFSLLRKIPRGERTSPTSSLPHIPVYRKL